MDLVLAGLLERRPIPELAFPLFRPLEVIFFTFKLSHRTRVPAWRPSRRGISLAFALLAPGLIIGEWFSSNLSAEKRKNLKPPAAGAPYSRTDR
jgi:hypothetical protein